MSVRGREGSEGKCSIGNGEREYQRRRREERGRREKEKKREKIRERDKRL